LRAIEQYVQDETIPNPFNRVCVLERDVLDHAMALKTIAPAFVVEHVVPEDVEHEIGRSLETVVGLALLEWAVIHLHDDSRQNREPSSNWTAVSMQQYKPGENSR
jgi:hypothetical protein